MIQRPQDIKAWTDGVGNRHVTFGDKPLSLRLDLRKHSPDGFNWGYAGSGPAQLALAMLAAVLGDDAAALELYQDYKAQFIAGISVDNWQISSLDVLAWVEGRPERAVWLARN